MKPRILMVDDDPANRGLVSRALKNRYEIIEAQDGEEAVARVIAEKPDLVIMDVMMPGVDGYEATRRLKENPDTAEVPVIFLSASDEVIKGFEVGAVDYIHKPMRIGELRARIDTHISLRAARRELVQRNAELEEMKRSLEERVASRTDELSKTNELLREEIGVRAIAEERLAYLARHDPLTRLLNLQTFRTELDRHLIEAARREKPHALIRLELTNLEEINAALGLAAGDDVVNTLANLVRTATPEPAIIARVGGSKVALSLLGMERGEVLRLAEELVRAATGDGFWTWDNAPHPVNARAAVVVTDQDETVSSDLVLSRADTVMRQTKSPVAVFDGDSERSDRIQLLSRWTERIRHALAEDGFVLYHQAIAPLATGEEGEHFEILLRMKGEEGRILPPGAFLPFVEELGFSRMVDRWVVDAVIRFLRATERKVALCAVNLSGQSLNQPAFTRELLDLMRAEPEIAPKLCFEVTETVAIVNLGELSAFLTELRELGCKASLDDFGAGFASYGYLRSLPVDYLKIDGQFVRDIDHDLVNRALVRSMNDVGHATGKRTIGEFVENERIRELLSEIGVDYAQGWGVHKPSPLE